MSTFSSKFSEYTLHQLNEFLEDDEKLTKIIGEMDEMQDVQQSKETTLVNNRTQAEQNLALQPGLELKKETLTKKYGSLQESFEAYQLRKSTLDQKTGNSSLDILLALLQAEGAKVEEETENMADSFLDGDVTLEAFIDSYQNQRKLAHLRRVKIEKLQEMVLKGHQLPQASPRRKPPAPPSQPAPLLHPVPTADPAPSTLYAVSPYPPIPPRTGQPYPNVSSGYPFLAQYPSALPRKPPSRVAPQPGFMIQ
ncbi:vacuolar protein sorting-associated protein 37B-like isoform X2 [Stigmatopora nigra]